MRAYRVRWEVDVQAENPQVAAAIAYDIQREELPINHRKFKVVEMSPEGALIISACVVDFSDQVSAKR